MTAVAARELSDIIFANAESLTDTDYKRSLDLLKVMHDATRATDDCRFSHDCRYLHDCRFLQSLLDEQRTTIMRLRCHFSMQTPFCARKAPCCKTCGQPRKGHARGPCVRV